MEVPKTSSALDINNTQRNGIMQWTWLRVPRVARLVQHSFRKFVTCWFCDAVSAAAMRARSARRAEDGTASRRNPGRQHPQAISSGHSYPFPRRSRAYGVSRRVSPPGGPVLRPCWPTDWTAPAKPCASWSMKRARLNVATFSMPDHMNAPPNEPTTPMASSPRRS